MNTIHKYPMRLEAMNGSGKLVIGIPRGGQVLSCQVQHEEIQLWAMVDPDQPIQSRVFRIVGTGQVVDGLDTLEYLGTVLQRGGQLVWHIYEEHA